MALNPLITATDAAMPKYVNSPIESVGFGDASGARLLVDFDAAFENPIVGRTISFVIRGLAARRQHATNKVALATS